jgi:hypothetical protein
MPGDPQHNIEQLLKASAEQRRQAIGPPMEMPGVTREMLHQEITRVYAQTPSPRSGWLSLLLKSWPSLAWGGAIGAVLLIAIALLRQMSPSSPQPIELAQQSKTKDAVPSTTAAIKADTTELAPENKKLALAAEAPVAAQPEPAVQLAQNRSAPAPLPRIQAPQPAAPSMANRASPPAEPNRRLTANFRVAGRPDEIAQVAGATEPAGASNAERFYFVLDRSPGRFRRNFNSPAPVQVLNSFALEYNGNQVRVVDEDGSVYQGQFETRDNQSQGMPIQTKATSLARAQINSAPTARYGRPQDNRKNSEEMATNPPVFFFQVTGTNHLLGQQVVFTGNYIPSANQNSVQMTTANAAPSAVQAPRIKSGQPGSSVSSEANVSAYPALISNQLAFPSGGVIQGQAMVGGTNSFPINAVQKPGQ